MDRLPSPPDSTITPPTTPPVLPGPLGQQRVPRLNIVVIGLLIFSGCAVTACFAGPLAMNSNIWPIAGVFWSALCVGPAAGIGALLGWLLRRWKRADAIRLLAGFAFVLAFVLAIVIANTP
jgi:hypothetical protein